MRGYRNDEPYVGTVGYFILRPPPNIVHRANWSECDELPANVAECFTRKETSPVMAPRDYCECPLHGVFVDEAGKIVEKSFRVA